MGLIVASTSKSLSEYSTMNPKLRLLAMGWFFTSCGFLIGLGEFVFGGLFGVIAIYHAARFSQFIESLYCVEEDEQKEPGLTP